MKSNHAILLLIVWAVIHALLLQMHGIRYLFDVIGYIKGADHILQYGEVESVHHIFYLTHILFIALSKAFFDTVLPYLGFQIMLSGIATWVLYVSAKRLFSSSHAGFYCSLIFLLWLDCIHWNTVLLSESLFCSLTIFLLGSLIFYTGRASDYVKICALLLLLMFTRPTSVVILVGVFIFFLYYYRESIKRLSKKALWSGTTIAILLLLLGSIVLFQKWDFTVDYLSGNIVTYMDTLEGKDNYYPSLQLKKEISFNGNHDLAILNMLEVIFNNPLYFIKLAGLKIFYLLTFYRPYYTLSHNLYNAIWLILVYAGFVYGFIKSNNKSVKAFAIAVILVNCALIAISTVDWDNRFFIPMEPVIVLFSGYGWYRLIDNRPYSRKSASSSSLKPDDNIGNLHQVRGSTLKSSR